MLRLIISSHYRAGGRYIAPPTCRCIYSTPHLSGSWMEKAKGVLTGKKTETEGSSESYTLLQLAEKMREVRELGKWKDYMVVRDSEATFTEGFERQEAIIRYLGGTDPAGENIDINQKKEAAKQCNCTLANVESALSNFTLAIERQRKIKQLKAEGKTLPKSMDEVDKLMGSSPMDDVRSKLLRSGVIISNAICPCGSQKLYKRRCGKDRSS